MFAVSFCALIQFGINNLNNIRSICLLTFLKKVQNLKSTKDIIVLEDAKFEENHELKFTVVFNHKRDESLRPSKNMLWSI